MTVASVTEAALPRTLGRFDLLSVVHGYEIVTLFCVASCRQVALNHRNPEALNAKP